MVMSYLLPNILNDLSKTKFLNYSIFFIECTELIEPKNSTLSCVNNSNTITCVLNCDEGFDYDHDVKDEYVCGNETYYYWDFQTNDNPYGRLPHCTGNRFTDIIEFFRGNS